MKKLFIMCVACLFTINMYAQTNKIAVINFKANVGISQQDVDGISSIFITYFSPQGWTLVERTQIDKVISEQGFQKSSMTESQMVRVGRILNLKKIVIGDVNVISGSYNLDVRIVDVETGVISAKDGATWSGTNYRSLMQTLANRIASKISIPPTSVATSIPASSSQETKVITIYGYLKIFPKNLGVFTNEPSAMIAAINNDNSENYGYDSWRLPTQEELEVIISNITQVSGIVNNQPYMTNTNKLNGEQKIVRLVTTDKTIEAKSIERKEAERKAQLARQEAERRILEAERLRSETYRVGQLYNKNGIKGIVFAVDATGRHGKIISLTRRWNLTWESAKEWCEKMGYGWRLPTRGELLEVGKNFDIIENNLYEAEGQTSQRVGYWTSTKPESQTWGQGEERCVVNFNYIDMYLSGRTKPDGHPITWSQDGVRAVCDF